uniref:Uncharacterized protein LOC111113291 isoform X2 n=1 Tax=Crassostrea virginica TaxID=6565 RepID=A0A8B8BW86_CRAVI|nr:uncharacterized protein LOC111113291 isoform X2 [Crassostrea virginica]
MSEEPGPSTAPIFSLTKPAENYCRLCQLIMTVCSDLFRDILSRHIQPVNLRGELNKNKNTLLRVLRIHEHKILLFPQSGGQSLSAKDMDLTILYTLLRNICGIPSHQNGWGNSPNTGDITLAACIERIREEKNAIASHSNIGEIDDNRFQDIWMKLQTDIVNIEKKLIGGDMYERAVKVLFSCELTAKEARESAGDFNRLCARMNSIARKQFATKRKLIRTSTSKKARIDRLKKQHSAATIDIKARIGRLKKATIDMKDQLKETDEHLSYMMQGRFTDNEKNIEAWIDRLEKQQSSDIQGLMEVIEGGLSAMKNEIKGGLSAVKNEIKERISEVEEKMKGRMSSMEEKIEDMKSRCYPLVLTSTMEVPGMYIDHISIVSPDKLWVSERGKLKQVDGTGHVLRTLDDEYKYWNEGGCHTVSVEGDFVFIAEFRNSEQSTAYYRLGSQDGIHKMTADGGITTLLTLDVPDVPLTCIHSSRRNGDLLIGLIGRVMRCDGTGRKIGDIELGEEGQRLYEYPRYLTENKMNGDIVVSDYMKDALVVVDRSGRHRFDYKGHSTDKSFRPRGVCTDVLGRILVIHTVTDDDSGDVCCISLLDRDGRFLTRLLTKPRDDDGFNSLCVDDNNNIYVAFFNKIKVFK